MSAFIPLLPSDLTRLHRRAIENQADLQALVLEISRAGIVMNNGVDRKNAPRTARITAFNLETIEVTTQNIRFDPARQIYFNFSLDGRRFFFAATAIARQSPTELVLAFPDAIYEAERRDSGRLRAGASPDVPTRVEIPRGDGKLFEARVVDCSYEGLGIAVPDADSPSLPTRFAIRFLDGDRAGEMAYAELRHESELNTGGWRKLGLTVSAVAVDGRIPVERRQRIAGDEPLSRRVRMSIGEIRAAVEVARLRRSFRRRERAAVKEVPIVHYANEFGESISAIIDSVGDPRGAPAVVIPPAWGRTKETLLPLAEILLRSFAQAGESLTVLRFDGTNRRGESHIDPECRSPGDEYLHFRFSRAVADVEASVKFVSTEPGLEASAVVLVTFSLAAVEGRRAVARNLSGKIAGWIATVGMVDLQSGLRAVSGGVDYAFGLRNGVQFGVHELVGVKANMDLTGADALDYKLVFLEDARRDMAEISAPVTWIHGSHDAWMDLERVRDVMSAGNRSRRRVIEVPTGHQLRTSREAIQTFQLISQEASRILLGREFAPAFPSPAKLMTRTRAERQRLEVPPIDRRDFWSDYLLGRDRSVGIELMTATSAYADLMTRQIDLLNLRDGATIVDLGSGTGGLRAALASERPGADVKTIEIDLVHGALLRSRSRWATLDRLGCLPAYVVADLNLSGEVRIPLQDGVADAVIASLFISYIDDPLALLREASRILRRGGRLVFSSLRRDADISRIYVHGVREVFASNLEGALGVRRDSFAHLQRQFLSDAGRLLDLEERGVFRFRDEPELRVLAKRAGLRGVESEYAFGNPPQAILLAANRR